MPQTKKILDYTHYCTSMACLLKRYDSSYTQSKILNEIQPIASKCLNENNPSKLIDLGKVLEARINKLEKEKPSLLFSEEAEDYIIQIKKARAKIEN